MVQNSDKQSKTRILIADDEADARMLVSLALGQQSFELLICENGLQALEVCRGQMPDLAVIDVQMPTLDGIEVCQWIKANSGKTFVPVLLLTSQDEVSDKVNGLNCGADDYITKPFALPELSARVHSFLRIKQLTDELHTTQNLLALKEKQLVAMQVAGAAAHELGQPLTSITLNCELLAQLPPGEPSFKQAVQVINSESRRLRRILDDLKSLEAYKTRPYAAGLEILDLSPGETQDSNPIQPDPVGNSPAS
jgi:DNA-binding response OmpR family regulator